MSDIISAENLQDAKPFAELWVALESRGLLGQDELDEVLKGTDDIQVRHNIRREVALARLEDFTPPALVLTWWDRVQLWIIRQLSRRLSR